MSSKERDQKLWQKHRVELVSCGTMAYRLKFYGPPETPVLNTMVGGWRDAQGQPFPQRDMELHRVGVSCVFTQDGIIECFPARWGQWTILSNPETRNQLPEQERFKILSVACMVKTADHQLVVCMRSRQNTIHPGVWHVGAAGFVDRVEAENSESVLFQAFKELEEELNVLPSDIRYIRQLGLCRHDDVSYEILLLAEVSLSAAEILERSLNARDSWEGKVHLFPESQVLEILKTEKWNPAGAAALMMYYDL